MPYAFETKKIKMPKNLDRRIKLTDDDKERIKIRHNEGESIHGLSRAYNVNRRLIQFVLFPERLELNKQLRAKRGGWKQYYNKEYNTKAIREHRQYKQSVLQNKI